MVWIWFNIITQKAIRRGSFSSVRQLVDKIRYFIALGRGQGSVEESPSSGGLIEAQVGLGWGAGRRHWRESGGKMEMRENGANRNEIGDEGDNAHGSAVTTLRAVPGQTSGRTS